MAYYPNYYFPTGYQPIQPTPAPMPQTQGNPPAGSGGGITWVQGEAAAKAYPVGAGQSVLLMDSENALMYIKSTDQSGMPLPLRVFEYTEKREPHAETQNAKETTVPDYVTRAEFEAFKEDMKRKESEAPRGEG
jgi:hypothetical protein